MRYPLCIQLDESSTQAEVFFPDLGRSFHMSCAAIDEVIDRAQEVLETYLQEALDHQWPIPAPSLMQSLKRLHPDPKLTWVLITPSENVFSNQFERINISMNRRVLARLDAKAKRLGKTRSAMIAEMALCYEPDALSQPTFNVRVK